MSLKFFVKGLGFFTDHLKHEAVNKITCRMPSANPRQLCTHYLKSFPAVMAVF